MGTLVNSTTSQGIIAGTKSHSQVYKSTGSINFIPLDYVLILDDDNITVFKNGLIIKPDEDYVLCDISGIKASSTTRYISAIRLTTDLIDGDIIQIVTNTFSQNSLNLSEVLDYFKNNHLYGGVPIGFVFYYAGIDVPIGTLCLDGQEIINCETIYPNFYNWVVNSAPKCTLTEYSNILINNDDQCGKFGIDYTAKTVRLPRILAFIASTNQTDKIGSAEAAGLPGITGTFPTYDIGGKEEATGSFKTLSAVQSTATTESTTGNYDTHLDFDASRSSDLFGKSSTVTPSNIRYRTFIKVYDAPYDPTFMNVTSTMSTKSNIGLDNLSTTGTTNIAHNIMPSNRYIAISLKGTGGSYTAPADGYIILNKNVASTDTNAWMQITNNTCGGYSVGQYVLPGQIIRLMMPVRKADTISYYYNNVTGSTIMFRFIYAQGAY